MHRVTLFFSSVTAGVSLFTPFERSTTTSYYTSLSLHRVYCVQCWTAYATFSARVQAFFAYSATTLVWNDWVVEKSGLKSDSYKCFSLPLLNHSGFTVLSALIKKLKWKITRADSTARENCSLRCFKQNPRGFSRGNPLNRLNCGTYGKQKKNKTRTNGQS